MQKTGELLRKTREEKKLSLHEIGLALKIGTKVLKAIEDGDQANLPSKTFLRGFVRSYAAYLRLDVDAVLSVFQEEMGSTRPPGSMGRAIISDAASAPSETFSSGAKAKSEPEAVGNVVHSNNMKPMLFAVVCVLAVALITGTKKIVERYQREAEVPAIATTAKPIEPKETLPEVDTPASVTNALAESTALDKTATKTAGSGNVLTATNPVAAANNAAISNSTTAVSPAIALPLAASSAPASASAPAATSGSTSAANSAASASVATSASASATSSTNTNTAAKGTPSANSAAAAPAPSPAGNRSLELIVEAMEGVEIEYSAPGGKPEKIKLSAEQVHTFKSKSGLKLSVTNGGAINLILNGRDLGVPGEIGKPIKLTY